MDGLSASFCCSYVIVVLALYFTVIESKTVPELVSSSRCGRGCVPPPRSRRRRRSIHEIAYPYGYSRSRLLGPAGIRQGCVDSVVHQVIGIDIGIVG